MHQHPGWPIRLWGTPERISAWAFIEPPDREFIVTEQGRETVMEFALSMQVDPAVPGLAREVMEWCESVAAGGAITTQVADGQTEVIEACRALGMVEDDDAWFGQEMRQSLDDLPPVRLHDGYSVRHVTGADLGARVAVHRAAWHPSKLSEEMYADVMKTWPYDERLDVATVAPDGEFAASCLVWFDPVTGVGDLEPVGAAPDHRGIGAAPAACMAAMHALRDAGGTEARVGVRGDDGYPLPRKVYGRLGFKPINRTRAYRREAK